MDELWLAELKVVSNELLVGSIVALLHDLHIALHYCIREAMHGFIRCIIKIYIYLFIELTCSCLPWTY